MFGAMVWSWNEVFKEISDHLKPDEDEFLK
jgi:hypothetical protein